MITRRGVAGVLGSAVVMGRRAIGEVGQGILEGMGREGAGQAVTEEPSNIPPDPPAMSHVDATRLLLGDRDVLNKLTSELFEQEKDSEFRGVTIDADLYVLKAMSPMAKLTFQRQRNVEKRLRKMGDNRPSSFFQQAVHKLMFPGRE
jgi:hypothetical protein